VVSQLFHLHIPDSDFLKFSSDWQGGEARNVSSPFHQGVSARAGGGCPDNAGACEVILHAVANVNEARSLARQSCADADGVRRASEDGHVLPACASVRARAVPSGVARRPRP